MRREDAVREIEELSEKLREYQYEYYVLNAPSVCDRAYDRLFDRLKELENTYPDLVQPDSPTTRVGSDLVSELPEVEHTIPVLSLDKAYTEEEVVRWAERTSNALQTDLSFVIEEKIDGVSIVLYYQDGVLRRAVTRGNGFVGNDVTANVKTIGSVPLRLLEPVTLAARGEIYLPRHRFNAINDRLETPYANPRNLAAGTLRRQKSSEVASLPLEIFVYEGYFEQTELAHHQVLERLEELGFRINNRIGFVTSSESVQSILDRHPSWFVDTLDRLSNFVEKEVRERKQLEYEIDGLVVKVDEIRAREKLGYTGHHPRWAIAFKFEAPQAVSTIEDIEVQVGRTGRITPVARIKPVSVAGTTVSNATLHNQDYINLLELSIGDTVSISKRGDVIPAVEKVIEKNRSGHTIWHMPSACPSCSTGLSKIGAHHFCPNRNCPAQVKGRIRFFVGKGQMDIEHVGPETIETLIREGLVRDIDDLYTCPYDDLKDLPGFGEKKVEQIKRGVEKSKSQPFRVVLRSLGIPELGPNVVELLRTNGIRSIDTLFDIADRGDTETLIRIPGIGPKTAESIVNELNTPRIRELVSALRAQGLSFAENKEQDASQERVGDVFVGQTWCITGSFRQFNPRSKAAEEIERRGGNVVSQVSGKTTHLLVGEQPGGKLKKAEEQGVTIVDEKTFLTMLEET